MLTYQQQLNDLSGKGFELEFFTQEKDYPITGKYTAYIVLLKKNGEVVRDGFSHKSHEEALSQAYSIQTFMEEMEKRNTEKGGI